MLENGFYDIPPGKVAAIVTDLEMHAKPDLPAIDAPEGWTLERVEQPDPDWYRALYRQVGEDYLWWSRLAMSDADLTAIIQHKDVELFVLRKGDVDGGIIELDHRDPAKSELAFFGVTDALIGTRAARYMMTEALARAWARGITMLYVHTCTLDNPKAVSFYRRSGFVPVRQQVEIADDPRALGLLSADAGAQIPRFGG